MLASLRARAVWLLDRLPDWIGLGLFAMYAAVALAGVAVAFLSGLHLI